jgi:hypothetical protein
MGGRVGERAGADSVQTEICQRRALTAATAASAVMPKCL